MWNSLKTYVLHIASRDKTISEIQIFELLKFKNEMTTAEHLQTYIQSK
jgi:hypothetical protein